MPANFPSDAQQHLANVKAVSGGATTFASRLVTLLDSFFGTSNPFGSAALVDTGTEDGDVPVLDTAGKLAPGVLPAATSTTPGAVTISTSIGDDSGVATPAMLRQAVRGVTPGFRPAVVSVTELTLNTPFRTPGAGLILAAGGGQGGWSSDGVAPANGGSTVIQYGIQHDGEFTDQSPSITARGGGTTGLTSSAGLTMLSIPRVTPNFILEPEWAFTKYGDGGAGGLSGIAATVAAPPQRDGQPGESLTAFIRPNIFIRLSSTGAGGAGGVASATGAQSGGAGANGYALFIRLG